MNIYMCFKQYYNRIFCAGKMFLNVIERWLAVIAFCDACSYFGIYITPGTRLIETCMKNTTMLRSALKHTTQPYCRHVDMLCEFQMTQQAIAENTRFNQNHLHDHTIAGCVPIKGAVVSVVGLSERPYDICVVLHVNRSTVDVTLLLPNSTLHASSHSVDFFSIRTD